MPYGSILIEIAYKSFIKHFLIKNFNLCVIFSRYFYEVVIDWSRFLYYNWLMSQTT